MDHDLNINCKAIKLLGKNRKKSSESRGRQEFLALTPKYSHNRKK